MKTQFNFILTLFVCSFLAANLFAQVDNFKNGYIITNQGDTVFGQIDLRTNLINQSQCRFRTAETAQPVVYKPFDIKGYFFTDDKLYFVSKTIEIDSIKINTFIEFLVKGIMNLYYFEYQTDKYSDKAEYFHFSGVVPYYFFEDETGKMYAVDKKPDKILSDNKLKSDNSYKGITTYILRDAPQISKNINNLQFTQKSMIKVTKDYHGAVCTDGQQCIVYQNVNPDKSGTIYQISPFVGYNFYDFVNVYSDWVELHQKTSFPMLGVEVIAVNPRWTKFVGFQGELSVSQLKISEAKKLLFTPDSYIVMPYSINSTFGKIKLGIIVIYPKYKLKPIVGCGLYISKLFGEDMYNDGGIGTSLTLGFDYALNTKHNLIFRTSYDKSIMHRGTFLETDYINSVSSAKIGFSF